MRPLVVLHVGAPVERLHADFAGKPFNAHVGGADGRGGGRRFGAQLGKKKNKNR